MSSLKPDNRPGRDRDRSSTRDRSRSRSNVRFDEAPRAPSPPTQPSYGHSSRQAVPGAFDEEPQYEERKPSSGRAEERSDYHRPAPARTTTYPQPSSVPYPSDDRYDDRYDAKGYSSRGYPDHDAPRFPAMPEDDLAYGAIVASPNGSRQPSFASMYPPERPTDPHAPQMPGYPVSPGYPYHADPPSHPSRSSSYGNDYAQRPRGESYTTRSPAETRDSAYGGRSREGSYSTVPRTNSDLRDTKYADQSRDPRREDARRSFSYDSYGRDANVVEFTPGRENPDSKNSTHKSSRLSVDTRAPGGLDVARSPGLSVRTSRLSVSGNRPDVSGHGDLPPPSPLLEAYHGTYQQISPMPLALRPDDDDDELDALEPLSPVVTRATNDRLAQDAEKKKKKSVKVDNYEEDAESIQKALTSSRVDYKTLYDILPTLTHDQMMHVRREYKKRVKVQGKGINLPKHIKAKLSNLGKENFAKVAYVTSLGRWESEGYWANFFYQSSNSRRELLIESLMGRTNREIEEIKDEFRDKRYSDNLVKCMEKELKMDKFRVAVLMALEGRRQEEQDTYPAEYRNRDVDTLHKALTAKQGGESVMLEIIVRRSDSHLKEVMKTYERMYQENFPRAALKKSSNLVGEVIAHILNGVINKPVRDALLLRHAVKDIAEKNKDEELRYELLISRMVRLHWDKPHLSRVKREYYEKYHKHLEEDIEDATTGEFADFMWELCNTPKKSSS